jgi:sulfatase modifying factor 1
MHTELIELPGGAFLMGSTSFYPEEAPVHPATVAAFAIEQHPVTNRQFAEFISATGYLTIAERPMDPAMYPGVDEKDLLPGAMVFRPSAGPVNLSDWRQWWDWAPGACWRHPYGPAGYDAVADKPDHPVVQVAYPDAWAYGKWADRRLPTEAEWEYAARAGSVSVYPWGDDPRPGGQLMANTWQGRFPYRNDAADGFVGTSPVGTFAPNQFGLVDMIGNVWEWTTTTYSAHHVIAQTSLDGRSDKPRSEPCCGPPSADPAVNQTLKGGSHLCAPEYCHRYRPAARSPQSRDSATTHIGFRCATGG